MMRIACDVQIKREQFALHFQHHFPSDSITALVGKSGSGKTSILRWIAGFDFIENSTLIFDNNPLQKGEVFFPAEKRAICYVGQSTGLFPFMSAEKNLQFAVKRASSPAYHAPNKAELITVFDIAHCLPKPIQSLSSGEIQRVSLVQALLSRPNLLLLDEALSAIDAERKMLILDYLVNYLRERALPMIFVSHDDRERTCVAQHHVVVD